MPTITPNEVSFCHAVSDVPLTNLRKHQITQSTNDHHNLNYLGNLYELKATFHLGQKTEAEQLWSHLTDNDSNIYLLLTASDGYSLWMLASSLKASSSSSTGADLHFGQAIPNLVIHLLQSLWLVINDLAGAERTSAFGRSVLASNLPIGSAAELQACLVAAAPAVQKEDLQRGQSIIAEFRRLACCQVGTETVEAVINCIPIAASKSLSSKIF